MVVAAVVVFADVAGDVSGVAIVMHPGSTTMSAKRTVINGKINLFFIVFIIIT
jgi:hypothetical protein